MLLAATALLSFSQPREASARVIACSEGSVSSFALSYVKGNFPISKTTVTYVQWPGDCSFNSDFTAKICTSAVTITGTMDRAPATCNISVTYETLYNNGLSVGCVELGASGACTPD